MKFLPLIAAFAAFAAFVGMAPAEAFVPISKSTSATTTYHKIEVGGVGVFYREAGPPNAPVIVLLHGFPTSSRMFETLIPLLAPSYHIIAPDYPGFGQSDAPPPSQYQYSFEKIANTIDALLTQLKIDRYSLYLQDYGGPVGFRMLQMHPERLQALIIQNANAYDEGLGEKWKRIASYWKEPKSFPDVPETFMSPAAVKLRHVGGSEHPDLYDPSVWNDEIKFLVQPGQREIQEALLYDYRNNVAAYPAWQEWLRVHQPKMLVVWGRNDSSFIVPGAMAYRRDVPAADIHILDAGHFALDEKVDEIAGLITAFMQKIAH